MKDITNFWLTRREARLKPLYNLLNWLSMNYPYLVLASAWKYDKAGRYGALAEAMRDGYVESVTDVSGTLCIRLSGLGQKYLSLYRQHYSL